MFAIARLVSKHAPPLAVNPVDPVQLVVPDATSIVPVTHDGAPVRVHEQLHMAGAPAASETAPVFADP
jgi:hypothetical protein